MPFLNKQERETFKRLLDDVMDDADLKDQFNKAQARRAGVVSDHTDAMLSQYMGMLREVQDDREERKKNIASATPSPSLEELKKKYSGPKKP